jgi:hypothetical protein
MTLPELLAAARAAPPSTRIALRDPIAAHGTGAIDAAAQAIDTGAAFAGARMVPVLLDIARLYLDIAPIDPGRRRERSPEPSIG